MAVDYEWAVNKAKLARAVKELVDTKKPVTEEAAKEIYVRLAGLVREEAPQVEVSEKEVRVTRRK